jgi:hypothetical protein
VKLRTKASAALLSVSCAAGGAAAMVATPAHAQIRSATSAMASAPGPDWHYAGKYYVHAECIRDGKLQELEGADDYQCLEEVEPDGTIAYWTLWVLFLPLRAA